MNKLKCVLVYNTSSTRVCLSIIYDTSSISLVHIHCSSTCT